MNMFDKFGIEAGQLQAPQWQGQQQPMPQQQMPQQQAPQPKQGLLSRVTGSPDFADKLAIGLGGMSLNPNQGLISMAQGNILDRREETKNNRTAQMAVQQLRSMGQNEAADMVEANPAMAKEVLTQIMKSQYAPDLKKNTSPLQFDPETGEGYYVQMDNDGNIQKILAEGVTGQTPQQRVDLERNSALIQSDMIRAQGMAADVFDASETLDTQMGKLRSIRRLVTEEGARTGIIGQFLPAFKASTAELKGLAKSLGIDIINSATFGALSEKELGLALSVGFDDSLQGEEMIKYIDSRLAAQAKLRDQLIDDARLLSSGIGYQEYIQMRTSKKRTTPIPSYGNGGLTDAEMDALYGNKN